MDDNKVSISRLSFAAFFTFIFGIIISFGGANLIYTGVIPKERVSILSGIALLLQLAAFVMSIVDLFKEERKKVLSIITIILSGLPILAFVLILIVVQFYAKCA